jgi:hypothetical protein
MFELFDLANIALPDNRREAALYLCAFALLVLVITGGVFLVDARAQVASIPEVYAAQPSFIRWGTPASALALLIGGVLYFVDVLLRRDR